MTRCRAWAIVSKDASYPFRVPIRSLAGKPFTSSFGIVIIDRRAMLNGMVTFASSFALVSFTDGLGQREASGADNGVQARLVSPDGGW